VQAFEIIDEINLTLQGCDRSKLLPQLLEELAQHTRRRKPYILMDNGKVKNVGDKLTEGPS